MWRQTSPPCWSGSRRPGPSACAADGSLQKMALFSIGLVLFLFIMMINVFLNLVLKREKE